MKALERLREQLNIDYPKNSPAFADTSVPPEEFEFFFAETVVPAFEKIKKELEPYHFKVQIERFVRTTRIRIGDGCSKFICYIRIHPKSACIILEITYLDQSIYIRSDKYSSSERTLITEKFDLSKVSRDLTEKCLVTIVSDAFLSRKQHLERMIKAEQREETEKAELQKEERRARLIELKNNNDLLDSAHQFEEIMNSERYAEMMHWIDMFFFYTMEYGDWQEKRKSLHFPEIND